jgi:predicted GH43/DUF377 family glycosyl hydrolase
MLALELFILLSGLTLALVTTGIFVVALVRLLQSPQFRKKVRALAELFRLTRAEINPVISRSSYDWEAAGVLNPAAVEVGGLVHLFYRAIGNDGVSRVGYASSSDGVHFDDRLPYPVFMLDQEAVDPSKRIETLKKNPGLVASGGSWVGVEDPRAVVIENKVYLSFSAFTSWDSLRIGVISIDIEDLLKKRWKWSRPIFLSAQNQVHKNWVIFPEKIKGKFAVLHGFEGGSRNTACIEYLDTLEVEPASYIQSSIEFRDDLDDSVWDSKVRGAGPPPLKTPKGWLVLYHANDSREPHRYKIGALLLDLEDPSKVIARSPEPILSPDAYYENDGKPGVVYACGALVRDGILRVYYGGGDMVVCTASVPLDTFLEQLAKQETPTFGGDVVKM